MSGIREIVENSPKMRKSLEIAKKRQERKLRLAEIEQKTLENAKKAILRVFEEMSNREIAEKLDIFESGVEVLKKRAWHFEDCISIAEKLDLDVEIAFGRFRSYRETPNRS